MSADVRMMDTNTAISTSPVLNWNLCSDTPGVGGSVLVTQIEDAPQHKPNVFNLARRISSVQIAVSIDYQQVDRIHAICGDILGGCNSLQRVQETSNRFSVKTETMSAHLQSCHICKIQAMDLGNGLYRAVSPQRVHVLYMLPQYLRNLS